MLVRSNLFQKKAVSGYVLKDCSKECPLRAALDIAIGSQPLKAEAPLFCYIFYDEGS